MGCDKSVEQPKQTGKPFELNVARRPNSLLERAQKSETAADSLPKEASETIEDYGPGKTGGVLTFGATGGGVGSRGQILGKSQPGGGPNNTTFDIRLLDVETVDKRYKEHYDRAQALLEAKQFDQALVAFDEAKAINPRNHSAYVGEAFCYFHKKNYGKSLAAIDFAIANAPNVPLLLNYRGQIRAQLGDFNGAIDDFSKIIKGDPRDAVSLSIRAQYEVETGSFQAAIADYNAALKERPNELVWVLSRGWAFFRAGRFREAAADATTLLQKEPKLIDAYFLRSAARWRMQDLVGGKSDFDEAVRLGLDEQRVNMLRPAFYPADGVSGSR